MKRRNPLPRAGGKNRDSGFTMVETLIVMAVIIILMAFALVRVVEYRDVLKITELDNAARDISMAAQNRAVLLQNSGRLKGLLETDGREITEADITGGKSKNNGTRYIKTGDIVLDKLVPVGTIDPALRDRGEFYIVYEPESGSVTDVFYMENAGKVTLGEALELVKGGNNRNGRMDNAEMVGYYGSEAATSIDTHPLPTPGVEVRIDNGDQLTLTVKYTVPSEGLPAGGVDRVPSVKLEYGGEEVMLLGADGGLVKPLADDRRTNPTNHITDKGSGVTSAEYKWVLDSLDSGKQFKDFGFPAPLGGDFTVTAGLTLTAPGCIDSAYYATGGDNSLFASGTTADTARIANLRHLQNLNTATSGLSDGIVNAEQLCDIDCATVRDADGNPYNFVPIENDHLNSYDGKGSNTEGRSIRNLYVNDSTLANAGLFAEIEGMTVKNVRLVDAKVCGSSSGSAGTVAGTAKNGVRLDDVQVYWTNPAKLVGTTDTGTKVYLYAVQGANAGGLVGKTFWLVTIKDSFAATTVEGTTAAGGLVGSGPAAVTASYADCYLNGANAAGLVGLGSGTVALNNCYAAGFIVDPDETANTAGLVNGTANVVPSAGAYSAVRLLDTASNGLDQPGVLLANYLADSSDARARYLYTKDDLTPENMASVLGSGFAAVTAEDTHVYNLRCKLSGEEDDKLSPPYVFPGLKDMPHYGDWAELEPISLGGFGSGFAYYEKYTSYTEGGVLKTGPVYGVEAYCEPETANVPTFNTLKSDFNNPVIAKDGYALILQGDIPKMVITYGGKDWQLNGSTWTMTSGYTGTAPTSKVESFQVKVGTEKYTLVPLPDQIMTGDLPDRVVWTERTEARHFFQKLTVQSKPDGGETEKELGERVFYFNPHFGRMIKTGRTDPETKVYETPEAAAGNPGNAVGYLDALEQKGKEPGRVALIRTPRHFYSLSAFQHAPNEIYYNYIAERYLYYKQELDIDYTTYTEGYPGFFKPSATGHFKQNPIGGGAFGAFNGNYDGDYHIIKNVIVNDKAPGGELGLFGKSTLNLENIVYEQDTILTESSRETIVPADGAYVGLLVGMNTGFVNNCAVYGVNVEVKGGGIAGGLVGANMGNVQKCTAELFNLTVTGVSGGGLTGSNYGSIGQSYALGRMTGDGSGKEIVIAGLAAKNAGTIGGESYAAVGLTGVGSCERYGVCRNVKESYTIKHEHWTENIGGQATSYALGWVRDVNLYRGDTLFPTDGYSDPEAFCLTAKLKETNETRTPVLNNPTDAPYYTLYQGQNYPYRVFMTTKLLREADTGEITGRVGGDNYIHYGLWPQYVPVGLTYYEQYRSTGTDAAGNPIPSYGLDGIFRSESTDSNTVFNTLKEDVENPVVLLDGYALVFKGEETTIPVGGYTIWYGREGDRAWTLTKTLTTGEDGQPKEVYAWKDDANTSAAARPAVRIPQTIDEPKSIYEPNTMVPQAYTLIPLPDEIIIGELPDDEYVYKYKEKKNADGSTVYEVEKDKDGNSLAYFDPFFQELYVLRQKFNFNPHFARTVKLANKDGLAYNANGTQELTHRKEDQGNRYYSSSKGKLDVKEITDKGNVVSIRTPRHLYAMSRYVSPPGDYYYKQELDLDYRSYSWNNYPAFSPTYKPDTTHKTEGYYVQHTIILRDKNPNVVKAARHFTYDGGCHIIQGVMFQGAAVVNPGPDVINDNEYCTGLFACVRWGDVANVLKNVVYKMDPKVQYEYTMGTVQGPGGSNSDYTVNGGVYDPDGANLNRPLILGVLTGSAGGLVQNCAVYDVNMKVTVPNGCTISGVGGLVGKMRGYVENSSAELYDLEVKLGSGGCAGGLVGRVDDNTHTELNKQDGGKIYESYAMGKLTDSSNAGTLGGLAGWQNQYGRIENCYAAMNLDSENYNHLFGFSYQKSPGSVGSAENYNFVFKNNFYFLGNFHHREDDYYIPDEINGRNTDLLATAVRNDTELRNTALNGKLAASPSINVTGIDSDTAVFPYLTGVKTTLKRSSTGEITGTTDPVPVHYGQWPVKK